MEVSLKKGHIRRTFPRHHAGRIRGYGHTRLAAIADLKEQIEDEQDDVQ